MKIFRINLRGAVFKQQTPHTAVDKLQLKKAYSKFNKNIINNTIKTPTFFFITLCVSIYKIVNKLVNIVKNIYPLIKVEL